MVVADGVVEDTKLKVDGKVRTTEELHAENVHRQREVEEALARGGLEKGANNTI